MPNYTGSGSVTTGGEAAVVSPYWTYNPTGGVVVSGEAGATSPDWHYSTDGGITTSGEADVRLVVMWTSGSGGVVTSGEADVVFSIMETGSGGVVTSGEADVSFAITQTGSGGVATSGSAPAGISMAHYRPTGGVITSGTATVSNVRRWIGTGEVSTSGTANLKVYFHADLDVNWVTRVYVGAEKEFSYNVGEIPLFFWQVRGKCVAPSCDNTSLQDIEGCPKYSILTMMARTIGELCDQLTLANWKWQIEEVLKFSIPVQNPVAILMASQGLIDPKCNQPVAIDTNEICQLRRCHEYCVHTDANTIAGGMGFVLDSIRYYQGTGKVYISGSAICRIPAKTYIAEGSITTGGEAGFRISNWTYTGVGGIVTSGEADRKSSQWDTTGAGGVLTSGVAGVVSDHWMAGGIGGITMGGTSPHDIALRYISIGGVRTAGVANYGYKDTGYTGTGGIVMGGAAKTAIKHYRYNPTGGLATAGEAKVVSPFWTYTPTGGVTTDGEAVIVRSHYSFDGSGGVITGGECDTSIPQYRYPALGGVTTGGEALTGIYHFRESGIGGVTTGGTAEQKSSHYGYDPDGGVSTGGESGVVSPDWHYESTGGITIGGESHSLPIIRCDGSGGVTTGGEYYAKVAISGTGGVTTGGEAIKKQHYFYLGSGGVTTGGVVVTGGSFLGEYFYQSGGFMEVFDLEPAFGVSPADNIVAPVRSIDNRCGCEDLPLTLEMSHDLRRTAILGDFLKRNGITFPGKVNLYYNEPNRSWQGNVTISGIGADGSTTERWIFIFEFVCTNTLSGATDGPWMWRFSMYIRRITVRSDFESRLLVGMEPDIICNSANDDGLNLQLRYNTRTGSLITTPRNVVVVGITDEDSIGLFGGKDFGANPILSINISLRETATSIKRMDISSIFPTQPLNTIGG